MDGSLIEGGLSIVFIETEHPFTLCEGGLFGGSCGSESSSSGVCSVVGRGVWSVVLLAGVSSGVCCVGGSGVLSLLLSAVVSSLSQVSMTDPSGVSVVGGRGVWSGLSWVVSLGGSTRDSTRDSTIDSTRETSSSGVISVGSLGFGWVVFAVCVCSMGSGGVPVLSDSSSSL